MRHSADAEQNCSLSQILYNLGYVIFSFKLLRKYWSNFSKIKHFKLVSQIQLKTFSELAEFWLVKLFLAWVQTKMALHRAMWSFFLGCLVVIIFIGIALLLRRSTGPVEIVVTFIYIYLLFHPNNPWVSSLKDTVKFQQPLIHVR